MAKFQITIEDSDDGVSIQVDNQAQLSGSKAGRVASALMSGAPMLLARIPVDFAVGHTACDCEICQAMREKQMTKPTIH
ncbi:hypothetical protein D3C76_1352540 [compost metagenome]